MIDSKVKKIFFLSFLTTTLCWAGLYWFWSQVGISEDAARDLAVKLENQARSAEQIRDLSRQVESLRPVVSRLDDFFVGRTQAGAVAFIELVERLARRSGGDPKIEQVTTSPWSEEENDRFEWLDLKFQIEGSRPAVAEFLKTLENLPYRLEFNRVELSSLSESLWRGSFVLRVLRLK